MEFKVDRRVMTVTSLEEQDADVLPYWLSRPTEERLAAVEFLRRQWGGVDARLQRVLRVTERPPR